MSDEDAGHDLYDTSAEDYAEGYRDGQREAWANPPPGYRLVPKEAEADQIRAAREELKKLDETLATISIRRLYRIMVAAPGSPKKEEGSRDGPSTD